MPPSANSQVYLAVDLGASSGRVMAGLFDGQKLRLEEVHRFDNGPVAVDGKLYWDLLALWSQVQRGLRAAHERFAGAVASVAVDTWGVDFALFGRGDELLGNPRNYRDAHTQGILPRAFGVVPREEIFAETGLQFMEFNTLYQLWALRQAGSPLLDAAERMLMMPDLFHWLLTGQKTNEATNASTTQMLNPATGDWARGLVQKFGLPDKILGPLSPAGTRIGKLRPAVADETGLAGAEVILPGTHDTASAVLAVPAAGATGVSPDWCYISSGTWSLMGVEVPSPVVSDACRKLNFTNEGGVGGTTRLLKNIAGLWLVQECRRIWQHSGRDFSWEQLAGLAAAAPPLRSLVNPDDPRFVAPRDMPQALRDFCRQTNQPQPESEGAVIRCALESLALRYRQVLAWLEELCGGRIETIHIVGGGAQNGPLCQMAADAAHRRVVAGPVEATAIGNVMLQAVALGDVGSIPQAREAIRRSFDVVEYAPQNPGPWDEAYARFQNLVETRE